MSEPIDPMMLMLAYRSGIFPMADSREDDEVVWIEPRRRAVLPLGEFHCSRSLARTLRRARFEVTCNADFAGVIEACAAARPAAAETWISERLEASYRLLHALGQAHSIECWETGEPGAPVLVGGLYGVGFDGVFCGESMFSRRRDASKVALAWLVAALRLGGGQVLDCQFMTEHLASLGAREISRARYLAALRAAQAGGGEPGAAGGASGADGRTAAGPGGLARLALPTAFAALLASADKSSSSPGNFIAQSFTQTS